MADPLDGKLEKIHAFGHFLVRIPAMYSDLPPMTNMSDTEDPDGGRDDVYCGG